MHGIFDDIADDYDRWYDTPKGEAAFAAERDCLLSAYAGPFSSWLEVGVGTGRFARALGIPMGLDASPGMSAIAARRGVSVTVGAAEQLPLREQSLEGVLVALTLCFVADGLRTLRECRRVLRPGGSLLLGFVPADSAWGRDYIEKAAKGHPVYREARFRTKAETLALAGQAGFVLRGSASTLFWEPRNAPVRPSEVARGVVEEAGFCALCFGPADGPSTSPATPAEQEETHHDHV